MSLKFKDMTAVSSKDTTSSLIRALRARGHGIVLGRCERYQSLRKLGGVASGQVGKMDP